MPDGSRAARLARALGGAIVLVSLTLADVAGARERSPSEVLASPGRYDGHALVVAGTISNLRAQMSKREQQRYYLFDLDDGIRALGVLKLGPLSCEAGAYAVVEGYFLRLRRHDNETFRNQVKASRVVCR